MDVTDDVLDFEESPLAETDVEEIIISDDDSLPGETDLRESESGGQGTVTAHSGSSATEIDRKDSKKDREGIANHSVPGETHLSGNGSGGQVTMEVHSMENNRKESESDGGKEDLEDGEICDSSEGVSDCHFVCRYYQRGLCGYGKNCRFLHPTEKGFYSMFDGPVQTFAGHFKEPNRHGIVSHSVESETDWDRALKEAMERVKNTPQRTAQRDEDAESRKRVGESVRSPSYRIRDSSRRAPTRYEVEAVGSVSLEKNFSGETKFRLNCRYSWKKSRSQVSDSSRSRSRDRHSFDRWSRKRGRSHRSPSKKIRRRWRSSSSESSSSRYSREKFQRWRSRERRSTKRHRSRQARSSSAERRPADIHGKTCRLSPRFREKKVPSSSAKSLQSSASVVSCMPRCPSEVVSDCRSKTVPSADSQRRRSVKSLSPVLENSPKSSRMEESCHRSPSDMSISSLSDVPGPEVFSCPLETETSKPSNFETRDIRLTSQMSCLEARDNRPTTKSSSFETKGNRLVSKSILETRDNKLSSKFSSLEKPNFGLFQKKTRETTTPDRLSRRPTLRGPKDAEEESSIAGQEVFGIPECSQSEMNDCRKSVASSRNCENAEPKKKVDPLLVDLMKYHGNAKSSSQRLVEETPSVGPEGSPARNAAGKRLPESNCLAKNDDKRSERETATVIRMEKQKADVSQRALSRKEYLMRYLREVDAAIKKKIERGQK